jgi:hypothetical protein
MNDYQQLSLEFDQIFNPLESGNTRVDASSLGIDGGKYFSTDYYFPTPI